MSDNFFDDMENSKKEKASKDLLFFATTYFPKYCTLSFSMMHREMAASLQEMTFSRKKRYAFAAPRGYAKSTFMTLIYVLWCICYKYETCIVIASSTKDQSRRLLSHIRKELESNPRLRRAFPEVILRPLARWSQEEIICKNGVSVSVSSPQHRSRGLRNAEAKPGLIILDDADSDEGVRKPEQREKTFEWFSKVVMYLGSDVANIAAVGTIMHHDSLLAKMIRKEDEFSRWVSKKYRAIISDANHSELWEQWRRILHNRNLAWDQGSAEAAMRFYEENKTQMLLGAEVLWKEKEDYLSLMLLQEQGSASFYSEKMNEPLTEASVRKEEIVFYDEGLFADVGSIFQQLSAKGIKMTSVGACDPSSGRPRGDYSAIVTAYVTTDKEIYVVDAEQARCDFSTLMEKIYQYHKLRKFQSFLYEENGMQYWLGGELQKKYKDLPVKPVKNTDSKDARIQKLLFYIKSGRVKLSKRLTDLIRQIITYPYCDHDDLLDALSMILDSPEGPDWELRLKVLKMFAEDPSSDKYRSWKKIYRADGTIIEGPGDFMGGVLA